MYRYEVYLSIVSILKYRYNRLEALGTILMSLERVFIDGGNYPCIGSR